MFRYYVGKYSWNKYNKDRNVYNISVIVNTIRYSVTVNTVYCKHCCVCTCACAHVLALLDKELSQRIMNHKYNLLIIHQDTESSGL